MLLEVAQYVLLVRCEWISLLCCCVAKHTGMAGMPFNAGWFQVFTTRGAILVKDNKHTHTQPIRHLTLLRSIW